MTATHDHRPKTTRKISFVDATREALDEALSLDPAVFLIGEDIADPQGGGVFKSTKGLSTKHGVHRVRSTPISEQAIMGAAVGAAAAGMRPVAEIMLMNFLTVAGDQLFNHAGKLRYMSGGQTGMPLTVRTATGGGLRFGAQHSDMLEAWIAHSPGLKVVVPSTPADAKGLLFSCVFDDDPCVFVEHTVLYGGVRGPDLPAGERIPLGVASVHREGSDATLISYGRMMQYITAAAASLAAEGIDVEVIDLRTISPLDDATILTSVAKTKRAVVVHEAVRSFGVGAEIASRINEELFGELLAPVQRIGSKNSPVPFAGTLEDGYLPSVREIEDAVRRVVGTSA